ncbi:unnamed protein product [Didymodactylos carnosus]|uniref:Uncharacterized protein n=1 Tax=Didymodactylos carnosus TaxID=1234261 RepID=A0A814BCG3_9BILA|nr:unnamed protein product [Didymodactylos carnosus]CAF1013671.1 unnamed protein product [Didymodactylos carnosus]CAF3705758.1 unnamed protein product [Didymodactylos carnosus]CAF3782553.1 unnamed protein product [Didymodactylos carnosus]
MQKSHRLRKEKLLPFIGNEAQMQHTGVFLKMMNIRPDKIWVYTPRSSSMAPNEARLEYELLAIKAELAKTTQVKDSRPYTIVFRRIWK